MAAILICLGKTPNAISLLLLHMLVLDPPTPSGGWKGAYLGVGGTPGPLRDLIMELWGIRTPNPISLWFWMKATLFD